MRQITILFYLSLFSLISNAQTKVPYLKKNGKYIYVDSVTMKPISNIEYDKIPKVILKNGSELDFTEPLEEDSKDYDKDIQQFEKDGWWGYVNNSEAIVIKAVYSFTSNFSNGFAFVSNDDTYGFIDKTGKLVIKGVSARTLFHNGLAVVKIVDKSEGNIYKDKCDHDINCLIDKKGTRLLYFLEFPCIDDDANIDTTKIDFTKFTPKGKYVMFKGGGRGFRFDGDGTDGSFTSYREGLIGLRLTYDNISYVSYVDIEGNIVIPPFKAPWPTPFKKGFSILDIDDEMHFSDKNNYSINFKYYIDKKGRQFYEK